MAKCKQKQLTLQEFVAQFPSQDAAAREIGIRTETLNRWLHGMIEPRGLSRRRLGELGIST